MRERGIPEDWSAGKASRRGDNSQFPQPPLPATPGSQSPETSGASQQPVPPEKVEPPVPHKPKRLNWPKNWVFWVALAGLISGGMGFIGVTALLKLPATPNCRPSIFWPMASASVRLYCAQVAADKQTVDDLLEAIALVQSVPSDHPWRREINSWLEQWSLDILDLGDEAFQAGKLPKAIAIARKIPEDVPAHKLVEERILQWHSIWSDAEAVYKAAEAEVRQQHWNPAFMAAVRLLNVKNNYWATTKYEELNRRIETTREDANKLAKAQNLAQRGGLTNLSEAIKLAGSIEASSYIYQDAQDMTKDVGRKMLDLAQEALDRRDATEAIAIANQIPASTSLNAEAQDFATVAEAWRSAWVGTVSSLEGAIAIAQEIEINRPLYNKAQELITRWQREIEDVAHIERAHQLAQGGTVASLAAAIAEAELIPDTNPRAQEAKQDIKSWRQQIETIEDQPYLDRAIELANPGDVTSLQAAINEAKQIDSGRALYREAESKIRNWTQKIQQIEDQPYLDRAEDLAISADVASLRAAIAEASQIGSGRALYREAQSKIWNWTQQVQRIEDQPYLNRAEELAIPGDVISLQAAVSEASLIGSSRALYREAQSKIRNWTRQIQLIEDQPYLDEARYFASSGNLTAAIATAQRIQPGRVLSREAQALINDWQGQIRARENWREARWEAVKGTPDALAKAIRLAERVPTTSPLRTDVNAAIEQWSQQIFRIAQSRGESDIPGGIAIAKLIPRGSQAYIAAQEQIKIWQEFLNPKPEEGPETRNRAGEAGEAGGERTDR